MDARNAGLIQVRSFVLPLDAEILLSVILLSVILQAWMGR